MSLLKLVWVAPLTLLAAIGACLAVRFVAQLLDPSLASMPQLQTPMLTLTVEGTVAAIVAFIGVALFVPRPIFWYRIVGGVALLVSLLPDVGLALGGAPMVTAMRIVGPLTSIGMAGSGSAGGPPAGGPPAGGPPPGFMSLEQVAVLMVLHVAVAAVCIALLTTLTRKRSASALA